MRNVKQLIEQVANGADPVKAINESVPTTQDQELARKTLADKTIQFRSFDDAIEYVKTLGDPNSVKRKFTVMLNHKENYIVVPNDSKLINVLNRVSNYKVLKFWVDHL